MASAEPRLFHCESGRDLAQTFRGGVSLVWYRASPAQVAASGRGCRGRGHAGDPGGLWRQPVVQCQHAERPYCFRSPKMAES